jgi:hypothetical protein
MSSSTIIYPPPPRGASRYFRFDDGLATTKAREDELRVVWDLTDYLASGETVSSAAYQDSGVTHSAASVSTPQVIFTVTGLGYTIVTATLSTGRTVEQVFYFLDKACGVGRLDSDYGG